MLWQLRWRHGWPGGGGGQMLGWGKPDAGLRFDLLWFCFGGVTQAPLHVAGTAGTAC